MIRRIIIGTLTPTDLQKTAADLDNDQLVKASDYITLRKKILNG